MGSANNVAKRAGRANNKASATAKGYVSEYFQAFSTGAPSLNCQVLTTSLVLFKIVLGCEVIISTALSEGSRPAPRPLFAIVLIVISNDAVCAGAPATMLSILAVAKVYSVPGSAKDTDITAPSTMPSDVLSANDGIIPSNSDPGTIPVTGSATC